MNVEEMRGAVESQLSGLMACHDTGKRVCSNHGPSIMRASDAYALAAHVDMCHAYPDEHGEQQEHPEARRCGTDWYCSVAQQYLPKG